MRLLLTGATGAAGLQVLRAAIADASITSISVLTRRPLPTGAPKSDKCTEIVLDDFSSYAPDLLPRLAAHDACIWALGTSSRGHTEESYAKITLDYVKAFIDALGKGGVAEGRSTQKNPFRFVFVSGEGADQEEKSVLLFARIKGRTEKYLVDLPAETGIQASILRPGWFTPSKEDANIRIRQRAVISTVLYPVVSALVPSLCTPVEGLGRVALEISKGKWPEETFFRNTRLRELISAKSENDGSQASGSAVVKGTEAIDK